MKQHFKPKTAIHPPPLPSKTVEISCRRSYKWISCLTRHVTTPCDIWGKLLRKTVSGIENTGTTEPLKGGGEGKCVRHERGIDNWRLNRTIHLILNQIEQINKIHQPTKRTERQAYKITEWQTRNHLHISSLYNLSRRVFAYRIPSLNCRTDFGDIGYVAASCQTSGINRSTFLIFHPWPQIKALVDWAPDTENGLY